MIVALRIAKIAKKIISEDYEYIYDPKHEKNPGGGYERTEQGWSKGVQDGKEKKENEEMTNEQKELHKMSKSKNVEDVINVASSKDVHPSTLSELSKHDNVVVRAHVARNDKANDETLYNLSKDEEGLVRMSVAKNKKVSEKILDGLKDDKEDYVRISVAESKNTNSATLHDMRNDKHPHVRVFVAENPNTRSITLNDLLKDERVSYIAAANPNLTESQMEDVFSKETSVASNPSLPKRLKDKAIKDKKYHSHLSRNPSIDQKDVDVIVDNLLGYNRDRRTYQGLVDRKDISLETLKKIRKKYNDFDSWDDYNHEFLKSIDEKIQKKQRKKDDEEMSNKTQDLIKKNIEELRNR